jgi:general secretion pathway protein K
MNLRSRRGVALVLVLWIVVILGGVSAGVVRSARTSTGIAANARADLIARAAAESGIEVFVAAIEDTLASFEDPEDRRDWLNALSLSVVPDSPSLGSFTLGDGRFSVNVVDVSARLDVNAATATALQTFFSQFTDPAEAAGIAGAIRAAIDSGSNRNAAATLPLRSTTPIRSLDELHDRRLVPDAILSRAAQYLTVDGDGVINARTASDTVLVAATGELRDEPSRLLLISRGWVSGHPLTREIQAVYSITGNRLVFSHWRERSL